MWLREGLGIPCSIYLQMHEVAGAGSPAVF
jgi:hypothetical protein